MSSPTCLVTGATAGIGLEIAAGLAGRGATVILHGRNPEKAERILENLRQRLPDADLHLALADLSSLRAVRELADEIRSRFDGLHVLINNAGIVTRRRQITPEGFDRMFVVNYLAPFYLTRLLTPTLLDSAPSRVLNLSSNACRWVDSPDLQNPQMKSGRFRVLKSYGAQKLMLIMHARELSRRCAADGLTANAHHPGEVATDMGYRGPWWLRLFWRLDHKRRLSPAEAAGPIVDAAVSREKNPDSGRYFELGKEVTPPESALDEKACHELWEISEKLVAEGCRHS